MAILFQADTDLTLFLPSDAYYYAIDNRPLRQLKRNDEAINAQVIDLTDKLRYIVSFIVESPSVEDGAGGRFIIEKPSTIKQFTISHGTPGTSGSFVIDLLKNGISVYGSPSNRPTLAWNAGLPYIVSTPPNISTTALTTNDEVRIYITTVEGGSPRWFRADLFLQPNIVNPAASSYPSVE